MLLFSIALYVALIFVGFDMVSCGALVLLLMRRGLDPRRVVIYAWRLLPVVEFAIQAIWTR